MTITANDHLTQEERIEEVEYHMEKVIEALGLDISGIHLRDTPNRVARMFVNEIFSGLYEPMPKFTVFDNEREVHEMVYLGNIDVNSTCSHHFKAFTGRAHIAYIPSDKLVGISKLARITDWFAKRPQVQEDLCADIADFLMRELDPYGVAVHISAVHNCIRVRGAKQSESVMKSTALRGCFKSDKTIADEFNQMINQL